MLDLFGIGDCTGHRVFKVKSITGCHFNIIVHTTAGDILDWMKCTHCMKFDPISDNHIPGGCWFWLDLEDIKPIQGSLDVCVATIQAQRFANTYDKNWEILCSKAESGAYKQLLLIASPLTKLANHKHYDHMTACKALHKHINQDSTALPKASGCHNKTGNTTPEPVTIPLPNMDNVKTRDLKKVKWFFLHLLHPHPMQRLRVLKKVRTMVWKFCCLPLPRITHENWH